MKRAISLPGSFILLAAAVTCTMGAIISGFGIEAEIWMLAIIWGIAAFALPASSLLWHGKGVLILLLPILGVTLWRLREIVEGAKAVIFYITSEYSKWLYIPALFPDNTATAGEISAFLAVAGVVLAALLYFAICLRRSTCLAIAFTAPFIVLTFIIIFTQPDHWYLIGILAVYLTLLIGNSIHTGDKAPKRKRIYTALSFTLALMLVAYIAVPPDSYNRSQQIGSLDAAIRGFAERTGLASYKRGVGWPILQNEGAWGFNTSMVSVADAGVRTISDLGVLEVTASKPGTYYLRGYSMQSFDGRTWVNRITEPSFGTRSNEAVARRLPSLICAFYNLLAPDDAQPQVDMTIERTGDESFAVVYTPYYAFPMYQSGKSYEWSFFDPDTSLHELSGRFSSLFDSADTEAIFDELVYIAEQGQYYSKYSVDEYLEIDSDTRQSLFELAMAAGIDPGADRVEIADKVAKYISSAGQYTLNPYITPEDEDFALHFLTKSKQGYCIHFATAAVLMLRALDVPARFTSGFVVTVPPNRAGKTIEVTDRNAHSWVEVFFDDVGWLMLEATPPAAGTGIPDGVPRNPGAVSEPGSSDNRYDYPGDMTPGMTPSDGRPQETPGSTPNRGTAQGAREGPDAAALALWIAIPVAIAAAALALALVLHRRNMRKTMDSRFAQEDTNGSVVFVWRYIRSLNRKIPPPAEIEEIALKARFSLHRISLEERAEVVDFAVRFGCEQYVLSNIFRRFWLVWGLGVRVRG